MSSFNVSDMFDGKVAKGATDVPVSELQGKVVALYFSAHWCPPCRRFTPQLIAAYEKAKQEGVNFELVFISFDRDQDSFDEYSSTMPWPSVKYDEDRNSIGSAFNVSGIPHLVVLDKDGKVITQDGVAEVSKEGPAAFKAWAK